MNNNVDALTVIIAICAATVVLVVTTKILRDSMGLGWGSYLVGAAGAILSCIGLMNMKGGLLFLSIPWAALAISLLILLLVRLLWGKGNRGTRSGREERIWNLSTTRANTLIQSEPRADAASSTRPPHPDESHLPDGPTHRKPRIERTRK